MTFDELFNTTVNFDHCELLHNEAGNIIVKTVVNQSNTNPYGKAHGGYLYTLCDSLAGLIGYSLGHYTVSLQGNINYIKEANLNDELTIEGKAVHNGRSTKVAEITIYNQNKELICKASITLFCISKVEE